MWDLFGPLVRDKESCLEVVQRDQAHPQKCVIVLHEKLTKLELYLKLICNHLELMHAQAGRNLTNKTAREESTSLPIINLDEEPHQLQKNVSFTRFN